jgi:hypothetical protein
MHIFSVRGGTPGWRKSNSGPNEISSPGSCSEAGRQGGKSSVTPQIPALSELPAWKIERNECRDLHNSVLTSDWIAARASWKQTRDLTRPEAAAVGAPPAFAAPPRPRADQDQSLGLPSEHNPTADG